MTYMASMRRKKPGRIVKEIQSYFGPYGHNGISMLSDNIQDVLLLSKQLCSISSSLYVDISRM
mgnify:CR=1 FL=1